MPQLSFQRKLESSDLGGSAKGKERSLDPSFRWDDKLKLVPFVSDSFSSYKNVIPAQAGMTPVAAYILGPPGAWGRFASLFTGTSTSGLARKFFIKSKNFFSSP